MWFSAKHFHVGKAESPIKRDEARCPPRVKRVILVVRRSRPVLLNEQTFSRSVGMSQKCRVEV